MGKQNDRDGDCDDSQITKEQVAEYLKLNPSFFCDRDDLLSELKLPHHSGGAISLMERQVTILRERNLDMRHRLNHLLDTARDNDKLFDKTKNLILSVLEENSVEDVVDTVKESLQIDFGCDVSSLTLFGNPEKRHHTNVRIVPIKEARREVGDILRSSNAVCGKLRQAEIAFLFPEQCNNVSSAAVVPLAAGNPFGILAIGSFNPDHFRSSMGTLFLSYVSEVLIRVMPRLMDNED